MDESIGSPTPLAAEDTDCPDAEAAPVPTGAERADQAMRWAALCRVVWSAIEREHARAAADQPRPAPNGPTEAD